jgi:cation diffusion facilitator family transporter
MGNKSFPNNHDHLHPHSHDHQHPNDHEHPHPHLHDNDHDHSRGSGILGIISSVLHLHGHSHQQSEKIRDSAFAHNEEGIRTVWLALAALTVTSVLQIVIVYWSGSVSLLADTVHNIGDGLNSIPLLIAFYLSRRLATRRYNYGFARSEDIAGIFIVLSIAFSAGVVFWQSFQRFINPQPLTNLGWVAAAAVVGFLGNEAVAWLQIRVGRKIGSAALVADGLHARTDGLTSLAVLLAVGGTWLGYPIVDPIIGFLIGIAILFITRDAITTMWYRLMDAIEPEMLTKAETVAQNQPGVIDVRRIRMRWIGHQLHADACIAVEPTLLTAQSHEIAEDLRHNLFHVITNLSEVMVHVEPWSEKPESFHQTTLHHEIPPYPLSQER